MHGRSRGGAGSVAGRELTRERAIVPHSTAPRRGRLPSRPAELSLSGHELSEAHAALLGGALARNATLRELAVGTPTTGAAAAAALAPGVVVSALRSIDLANRGLEGAAGGAALGAMLAAPSTLASVDASRNALGDEGVEALATALGANASSELARLDLAECGVGDAGAAALAAAMCANGGGPALQALRLAGNATLGCAGAAALVAAGVASGSLRELDLSDTAAGAGAGAAEWLSAHGASVSALTLARCKLAPEAFEALVDGMEAAGGGSSLEMLDVSGNECVGDAGAVRLAERALAPADGTLAALDLSECGVGAVGAGALFRAAGGVRRLSLRGNEGVDDGGALELAAVLRVRGDGETAAAALASCEELCLASCGIGAAGAEALFDALAGGGAPSLRTLEMGGNDVGDDACMERWKAAVTALREARPALDVQWKAGERGDAGMSEQEREALRARVMSTAAPLAG